MNARHRGYVLLLTLGLLVLASSLLVAVAQAAARHAAEAALEQQRVRRHWAIESTRAATLPYAEQIIATAEQERGTMLAERSAEFALAGMKVSIVVADEQAKANVNELLAHASPSAVENQLRRTLTNAMAKAHLRLRPAPPELSRPPANPSEAAAELPPISGFGQVFDNLVLADLAPATTGSLTVWGDGALNILRAGRPAMQTVLSPTLSPIQIDRILAARGKSPSSPAANAPSRSADPVDALLARANVTGVNRARVALVGRSTCHSVLIVLSDGRRVWYDQTVQDDTDPRQPRRFSMTD